MTAQTKSALFKIRKSFSKQIKLNHLLLGDGCCCYPCTEGVQAAVAGGVVWCGGVAGLLYCWGGRRQWLSSRWLRMAGQA